MSEERMVQFFDEMNLMKSEKQERLQTAEKIKQDMTSFFSNQMEDLILGIFYTAKTRDDYIDDLIAMYLSFAGTDDDYMQLKARRWATEVQDTTEKALTSVGEKGITSPADNLDNTPYARYINKKIRDMPEEIQNVLSGDRAEKIGMHESNVIHNYKRHLDIRKGQYTHTWETMRDEKVRIAHAMADGQTVPVDTPFTVMGEKLMFPGDDSLGASPENIINCRCLEL